MGNEEEGLCRFVEPDHHPGCHGLPLQVKTVAFAQGQLMVFVYICIRLN